MLIVGIGMFAVARRWHHERPGVDRPSSLAFAPNASAVRCAACERDNWQPLSFPGPAVLERIDRGARLFPVEVVVSHCNTPLHWLSTLRSELSGCGVDVRSIRIYSKCGRPPVGAPANATVVSLPNVGRCDHTYAHHMAHQHAFLEPLVLFVKDSMHSGAWGKRTDLKVPICHVAAIAHVRGMGCHRRPWLKSRYSFVSMRSKRPDIWSDYHITAAVKRWRLGASYNRRHDQLVAARRAGCNGSCASPPDAPFASPSANLAAWLRTVEHTLPERQRGGLAALGCELVPVCYGGNFAASRERIQAVPRERWMAYARALARGNNIEEGHFMERMWAALLTAPARSDQTQRSEPGACPLPAALAAAMLASARSASNVGQMCSARSDPRWLGTCGTAPGMLIGCSCEHNRSADPPHVSLSRLSAQDRVRNIRGVWGFLKDGNFSPGRRW